MTEPDQAEQARLRSLEQEVEELRRKVTEAERRAERRQDRIEALEADLAEKTETLQRIQWVTGTIVFRVLRVALGPLRGPYMRLRRLLFPNLGLVQYEPKPLRLPARYHRLRATPDVPSITIATPSFKQAQYIGATIESIVSQGYPKLEYVVQDGGSTDGTVDILQKYADRLHRWESAPDTGQANAINRGFAGTTGEIMAFLNSDDILLPGSLAYVGRFFANHPHVDVIYGHRINLDAKGDEIGRWILPPHDDEVLSWADFVPQETLFWRRSAWERAGGHIDESFHFALDWDLLIRLRDAGAKIVRVPRFLAAFRVHDVQKTHADSDIGFDEMERVRTKALGRKVTMKEINQALRPYFKKQVLLRHLYRFGLVRP